jgi:hypothetical protein
MWLSTTLKKFLPWREKSDPVFDAGSPTATDDTSEGSSLQPLAQDLRGID